MSSPAHAQSFRHRENQDGSWDSICLRCYLTAAHSYAEQPLTAVESQHHCDETSWLFKEPILAAAHAPQAAHPALPARMCPPSAIPRFSISPEYTQFSPRQLREGHPAGLREPAALEIRSGC
jgi:hypothetical protein